MGNQTLFRLKKKGLKIMFEKRTEGLIEKLQQEDLIIVTSTLNIQYLTGFYSEPYERLHALIILPTGKQYLLLPSLVKDLAIDAGVSAEVIAYDDHEEPWALFIQKIESKFKTIYVEGDHLTYHRYLVLRQMFSDAQFKMMDEELAEMRMQKSQEEIALLQKSVEICEERFEAAKNALREGVTELEIVDVIRQTVKESEADGLACEPIVLFGENTANPHGEPSTRILKQGDFVQMDYGVSYKGYCSDMARAFVFGRANEKQKELYEIVLKAQDAAIQEVMAGNTIAHIDQAARQVIANHEYGEHFLHRTGHGIGIDIHEQPSIHGGNEKILIEGAAVTIEPGIYVTGFGGVRIEDDVVATKEGPLNLSQFPKHLIEIM